MKRYFNDSPIKNAEEDRYGVTTFAKALAKTVKSIESPIGTAIALNGPWGSGKSSVINIVRAELEKTADAKLVISDFKCWWYQGEEKLLLAFLQNLDALLRDSLRKKAKGLVPRLGKHLLQAGPVVGSALALTPFGWLAPVTGASFKFARRYFPEGDTLTGTFQALANVLEKENRRFLIIVDDIDRLSPDEAVAVFRTIKSVGCLPNVMYLLAFDRALADKAVAERYPTEGPHFLEKIIQLAFELPEPLRTDLNAAALAAIEEICGPIGARDRNRVLNVFHDIVVPYMTTPRHVARFQNALRVTWPAIAHEVNVADYVGLETIRLYEPGLFRAIRGNKASVCIAEEDQRVTTKDESRFTPFLSEVATAHHDTAKLALQRLFPKMEDAHYSKDFNAQWDAERRVCDVGHFDTYFRLSLSDEKLSMEKIGEFISRIDDGEYVKEELRKAAVLERGSGTSMIPVLLDELIAHARSIPREKVEPFLSALFEIHDEIDLNKDTDRGMIAYGNTTLRCHWLARRLTERRFTLEERTDLFLEALKKASLEWRVNFVAAERTLHQGSHSRPPSEEDLLVGNSAIDGMKKDALNAIRSAAQDGTLLQHQDLGYVLYRWRDFMGDNPAEVQAWTDPLLEEEGALVILARAFTGESWSAGLGVDALGDRTATRSIQVHLDKDTGIIDVEKFRAGLGKLQRARKLCEEDQHAVDEFLEAWKPQREAQDESAQDS